MPNYTNKGLVNHAQYALNTIHTKYMWGGLLRSITDNYINLLTSMYPDPKTGYTAARKQELRKYVGKNYYGVDCVGLIKSYYWSGKDNGGTGSPYYGAKGYPDVNANYMYQQAKEKGPIKTMPEIPGLILYSKTHPHVGIYIGNGYTIESTLGVRGDGVIKHKLDSFWEYWFKCPYITYVTDKPVTTNNKARLAFKAAVREQPSASSKLLGVLEPGTNIVFVAGTEAKDPKTGFTYIKIKAPVVGFIVKTAF